MRMFRSLVTALAILTMATVATADTFRVDPAATFLHTNNDPAPDALVIDLSALSFPVLEGDVLRLERHGSYAPLAGAAESQTAMIGVFSVTRTLLSSNRLVRLTGAIPTGTPFVTAGTQDESQPTDISQDFLIDSGGLAGEPEHAYVDVKVPKDARFLFVASYATHYSTNTDGDKDYSVSVALAPARTAGGTGRTNTVPESNFNPNPARPPNVPANAKPVLSNLTLFRTDGNGSNQRSMDGIVEHGGWTTVQGQQNIPGNFAASLFISQSPSPSTTSFLTPSSNMSIPLQLGDNVFYFFGNGDDVLGGNIGFGVNIYLNRATAREPSISGFVRSGLDQSPLANTSVFTAGYDCHLSNGSGSLTWTVGKFDVTLTSLEVTPSSQSTIDLVNSTNTRPFIPPAHADGTKDTFGKIVLTVTEHGTPAPVAPAASPPVASAAPAAPMEGNASFFKNMLVVAVVGIILLLILVMLLVILLIMKLRQPRLRFPPPTRPL